mgnify:CR=1 FL=1
MYCLPIIISFLPNVFLLSNSITMSNDSNGNKSICQRIVLVNMNSIIFIECILLSIILSLGAMYLIVDKSIGQRIVVVDIISIL